MQNLDFEMRVSGVELDKSKPLTQLLFVGLGALVCSHSNWTLETIISKSTLNSKLNIITPPLYGPK